MVGVTPPPVNPEYLFRETNWDTIPVMSRFYNPVVGAALGFGFGLFVNGLSKKPIMSGIYKHFIGAGVGLMGAVAIDRKLEEDAARREAMLRHYISLHPEDFPVPERKQFKDMLYAWTPVR